MLEVIIRVQKDTQFGCMYCTMMIWFVARLLSLHGI